MLVQIRRVGLFTVVLLLIILSIPSTVYAKKVSKKKKERLNETSLSIKEDEAFQLKVVNKGKKGEMDYFQIICCDSKQEWQGGCKESRLL